MSYAVSIKNVYLIYKHQKVLFMQEDKPSILLIYTGGTIGMIENETTGALESFNFEYLMEYFPQVKIKS